MGLFVSFSWPACLLMHWSGIAVLFCCFYLVFNEIKAVSCGNVRRLICLNGDKIGVLHFLINTPHHGKHTVEQLVLDRLRRPLKHSRRPMLGGNALTYRFPFSLAGCLIAT